MARKAQSLLTEDEIRFIAYIDELARLIKKGIIREEDPFPEDIGPVEEEDGEGYEDD